MSYENIHLTRGPHNTERAFAPEQERGDWIFSRLLFLEQDHQAIIYDDPLGVSVRQHYEECEEEGKKRWNVPGVIGGSLAKGCIKFLIDPWMVPLASLFRGWTVQNWLQEPFQLASGIRQRKKTIYRIDHWSIFHLKKDIVDDAHFPPEENDAIPAELLPLAVYGFA